MVEGYFAVCNSLCAHQPSAMEFHYFLGPVSIRKTVFPGMGIPMLKIRRPVGRLIFNMGIAIPSKTIFLIETAPWQRQCIFVSNLPHGVGCNISYELLVDIPHHIISPYTMMKVTLLTITYISFFSHINMWILNLRRILFHAILLVTTRICCIVIISWCRIHDWQLFQQMETHDSTQADRFRSMVDSIVPGRCGNDF